MLLFACVVLNTGLIGCYLFRPLLLRVRHLRSGFERAWRYLQCAARETREIAFRGRMLLLMRDLALMIGQLLLIALCYGPSLALAHYRSQWTDALASAEAIAGMVVAALFCGWRLSRS